MIMITFYKLTNERINEGNNILAGQKWKKRKKKKGFICEKKQSRKTCSPMESSSNQGKKPSCCLVSSPPEKGPTAATAGGGSDQQRWLCAFSYGLLGLDLMETQAHIWNIHVFSVLAETTRFDLRPPAAASCGWHGGRQALGTT